MPYVETAVGRLFVQTSGQGTPVAFWPCLLGDGGIWHAQVRALASSARTIVVDGPGHGRSAPPPGAFTLEQCADAWIEVLDAVGATDPAVFVGLSWGAMTALRVALRHPARVRSLGLLSAIATSPRRAPRLQFAAFATLLRTAGVASWLVPRLVDMMVSRSCSAQARDDVARMFTRCATLDRAALHRGARAVLVDPTNIVADLRRVRAHALVCVGADDRVTPLPCARRIASVLPDADLRIVERAGHLLALEAPDEVSAHLSALVSR
jgi:3-oxoadipate enol-lactonase